MKKITILTLLFIGSITFVIAQTDQGRIIAGGGISAEFNKEKNKVGGTSTDGDKTSTIIFNPTVGYFVIDRLAVGAEINFQTSTRKPNSGDNEFKSNAIMFGPFVKYYLDNGLFGMGSLGIGSGKSKSTIGGTTNENKIGLFQWRLGAGYAAFLNDNVAIEPMLSYGSVAVKYKDSDPTVKDVSSSFRISVAFTIFLDL